MLMINTVMTYAWTFRPWGEYDDRGAERKWTITPVAKQGQIGASSGSSHSDAWPRPRKTSQSKTRTTAKYSRRTDTNRDLALTRRTRQIASSQTCIEF